MSDPISNDAAGMRLSMLRESLAARVRGEHPGIPPDAVVPYDELGRIRRLVLQETLTRELGEVTDLEQEVIDSLAGRRTFADNVEDELEEKRTVGDRASDGLASFGGSWRFIILFGVVLVGWMALNMAMAARAFDPYPFILLNLVLSCIAAVQAPIIMMSQRRQETKDRARSLNDYQVNLRAELEIRNLHEKLDHLMVRQWDRINDIHLLLRNTAPHPAATAGTMTESRQG